MKMLAMFVYESLYEYVEDGDWTDLHCSRLEDQEYAIEEVDLIDQPDQIFMNDEKPELIIDGRKYIWVNCGEPDDSYIPEDEVGKTVWFLYHYGQVISKPYPNREKAEEAMKWMEENHAKK